VGATSVVELLDATGLGYVGITYDGIVEYDSASVVEASAGSMGQFVSKIYDCDSRKLTLRRTASRALFNARFQRSFCCGWSF
jgi:hypothetical protein